MGEYHLTEVKGDLAAQFRLTRSAKAKFILQLNEAIVDFASAQGEPAAGQKEYDKFMFEGKDEGQYQDQDGIHDIQSISVVAHDDHWMSTLTDSLICKAGIMPANHAEYARFTDPRADEQERGAAIESTSVSL